MTPLTERAQERRGPHPVADTVLAVTLLVVDAVASLIALVFGLDAAGYDFWDSSANSADISMAKPIAYVCVVGALVLASAVAAYKSRAIVTTWVQALVGLALVLGVAAGLSAEYRDNHPPAPEPGYSGPQTQCLSGGDNSECLGS